MTLYPHLDKKFNIINFLFIFFLSIIVIKSCFNNSLDFFNVNNDFINSNFNSNKKQVKNLKQNLIININNFLSNSNNNEKKNLQKIYIKKNKYN